MKKLSETYKELGIDFTFPIEIKDENGKETYYETGNGNWYRREYDKDGLETYYENSDGNWYRCEYDENGNETYYEYSNGYWYRHEYDKNGKVTYYEDSSGYWYRCEYDEKGNRTYYENSNGTKKGTKRGSCSGKVVEVDGKKYKLTAVKDYEYKAPAWVNWPV
jgi:hypothetical protein